MKPKNFIIKLNIYPFDVMVSVAEKDKDLIKKLKKGGLGITSDVRELIAMTPTAKGRTVMFSTNQTLIRLLNLKDIPTMAHEVFHATTYILGRTGTKFKLNISDEPYAYLMGYIMQEILKHK